MDPDLEDRSAAWPLTYVECRDRFRWAAAAVGVRSEAFRIDARGPVGEELTIDVARLGPTEADRVLVIMSGTHGIEGYAGSVIQVDLLRRMAVGDVAGPGPGVAMVLIHGVNPWGMSWWRRANESNVDLNRNHRRFRSTSDPAGGRAEDHPVANEDYADVHDLLCPPADGTDDGPMPDDGGAFVTALGRLVESRGLEWLRRVITTGQYTHPDGLYYGGSRREQSTEILAEALPRFVGSARALLGIDIHTGLGRYGTYTLLSRPPLGSEDDRWLRIHLGEERITTTGGTTDAPVPRVGQLLPGLVADLQRDLGLQRGPVVTFELGTRSETRVIAAQRAEHWVHRFGDRSDPGHTTAVWEHRVCAIPDDPAWERSALAHGRSVLDAAMAAIPSL